jgi:PPP family 3-phenylpropionic acid transporter
MLGRRRDQYGKQRLWGTLGWGVAGPLAGVLAERAGLNWNFGVCFVLYALGFLVALRLPVVSVGKTVPFWRGLHDLVTVRWWLPFMVAAFAVGVGQASLNQLLFLRLADLGVRESVMGLSLAFIMVGELPVLFYSDRLLRRLGSRGLFLLSIVAAAMMLFAVSWMRVGWVILPIQLLHGMAFNGKATAILLFLSQAAPRGMQATTQTLYNAIGGGLAASIGGILGGALFDSIGSAATFRLFGVTTLIAAMAFALVVYRRSAAARPVAE